MVGRKQHAGLAGAVRRFLAPACLILLVILGLHSTVYGQNAVNGGVRSVPSNEVGASPPPGICNRTRQARDAIAARILTAANCAQVTTARMVRLRGFLHLRNTRLGSPRAGDFAGLAKLKEINLEGKQLSSLPSGAFAGLSSLDRLGLQGNQLSSQPDGVFAGLSPLPVLLPYKNAVGPLLLTISLEKTGNSGFKATVPAGAPFAITLPVIDTNLALPAQERLEENPQPLIQDSAITPIPNGYLPFNPTCSSSLDQRQLWRRSGRYRLCF